MTKAFKSVAVLAIATGSLVEGHGGGWGSCGGGGGGWYPSHHNRYRRYGGNSCGSRRRYRYNRSPMGLVGEMFSVPIYINSLFRAEQEQRSHRHHEQDEDADRQQQQKAPSRDDGDDQQEQEENRNPLSRLAEQVQDSLTGPRFYVSESSDGSIVEMKLEVPGVAAEDLTIEIENDTVLRIRGSRSFLRTEEQQQQHRVEFERVFELDNDMDINNLQASLERGILTLQVPRKAKVVKRIPIHRLDNGSSDYGATPEIVKTVLVGKKKILKSNKVQNKKEQKMKKEQNGEDTPNGDKKNAARKAKKDEELKSKENDNIDDDDLEMWDDDEKDERFWE